MTTIDYAMRVATQLEHDNKREQASLILNSILDANPTQADALHLSGIIAYQSGNITAGIQFIQQAIDSNPTVALFHSNLAEMHRQLKNIELSIQCGQRAILLDPHSAIALSNLGIAYYDEKHYDFAEDYHQRALAIDPKLSASLNNMGSIYKIREKTQEAITFYQAASNASPNYLEPLNNLGMLLLTLNQHNEALRYFEKALQLKSDCAEAHYGIAKFHFHQHDFMASENAIKKAIAINPQQTEFYQLLADIYCEHGKHAEALNYLDHALSIDSTLASLYLSQGSILMEMGEIAKAETQFSKVIDDASIDNRLLAHYSLVQLRKTKPESADLKALLSIANSIQDVSPDKQAYLYFALGKCYDDLKDSKKAFDYFTQGCNLKRKQITYAIADHIQFTHQLIAYFTKETIDSLRAFASPSSLPIFIVGMPRSGTTLVEQILASHPDVYGAGELTYLNDLIPWPIENRPLNLSPSICQIITNQYLFSLQHLSADASHITDKMPQNFIAIGLIHALFPNAKIIHVKRNPIDTCLSCYTKLFRQGQLYSYDLTELGDYYRCYELIMDHWRRILPSDAWLEINYEAIINNVEEEAKRLTDYCDLTWDKACLAFYECKRQVRTASFMQVREPLYASSVNRWRRFEKELEPLIKMLDQR